MLKLIVATQQRKFRKASSKVYIARVEYTWCSLDTCQVAGIYNKKENLRKSKPTLVSFRPGKLNIKDFGKIPIPVTVLLTRHA